MKNNDDLLPWRTHWIVFLFLFLICLLTVNVMDSGEFPKKINYKYWNSYQKTYRKVEEVEMLKCCMNDIMK